MGGRDDAGAAPRPVRVLILGAAGGDFHDFNVVYRDDPVSEVVAFTAAQIPGIAGRRYPRSSPARGTQPASRSSRRTPSSD